MNVVEVARKRAVERLYEMKTFEESFEVWSEDIEEQIGQDPDFHDILGLGDEMRSIFRATGRDERDQSAISGGGAAWEGLVCWYLNLCLVGTRTVVIKHSKELIPEPIANGITVNYGAFISNTESDLVAITFPDNEEISRERDVETLDYKETVNSICKEYFESIEVGVIQCKTNWNDNAQIPMLWDMIYSSEGFEDDNITIGKNGFRMKDFRDFFYAFATVPTNKTEYKTTSVAVKRVTNLSGGNYWGRDTKDGVAQSLKELFNGNFDYSWSPESQRNVVDEALEETENLSYFGIDVL